MKPIKRVLLATDFSATSENARDHAAAIAAASGAELHVLHVQVLFENIYGVEEDYPGYEAFESALRESARAHVASYVDVLTMPVIRAVERDVSASDAILRYAAEYEIDLIVIGTHSRKGVSHYFLGSVATQVMHGAECSVMTVGPQHKLDAEDYREILVAVDYSEASLYALTQATSLAKLFRSHIVLLHVLDFGATPPYYPETFEQRARETAQEKLDEMLNTVAGNALLTPVIATGTPHACIVEQAWNHNADLIVTGTTGLSGLGRFMVGSVTDRVMRKAKCPVLACREPGVQETQKS